MNQKKKVERMYVSWILKMDRELLIHSFIFVLQEVQIVQ